MASSESDRERQLRGEVRQSEPGAAVSLADLLRQQGRVKEAQGFYELAADRREPGAMVRLGDMLRGIDNKASEAAYREALSRQETEAAVRLGDVLRADGRLQEAVESYRLGFESGDPEGRTRLGDTLTTLERPDEAAALYREGLDRGEHEMGVRLGDVLTLVGNLEEAQAAYVQAVNRGDPEANTRLGDLYAKMGRPSEALESYERGARTGDPGAAHQASVMALQLEQVGKRPAAQFPTRGEPDPAERPSVFLPAVTSDESDGVDLLDLHDDVDAIANLVAAADTVPPLSVGLFGDWGSGKSFFIGKVQQRVRELAQVAQETQGSPYCGYVRNISFNAWHYADSNLWASLVTHIFDQLARPGPDAPAGTDAAAQVAQLEAQLAENSALKERLLRARDRRRTAEARRKLLRWTWQLTGAEDEQSLDEVKQDVRSIRSFGRLIAPNARARLALLGIAVLAAVAGFVLVALIGGETVARAITALAVGVATPFTMLALVRKHVLRLLAESGKAARAVEVRESDIDAEVELASIAERELQEVLADLSAGRRLARVASERRGDYREHLGLTSRIHDDFIRMSDLLRRERNGPGASAAGSDSPDELPRIDRIVLYIDDLDRCPPRRVLEVLEAVHLILAVPLFVVVVAVDPRWLLQSLRLHYAEMLAKDTDQSDHPTQEIDSWGASPIDYLEKIIQVPFALRPMSEESVSSLVHGLLPMERRDGELDEPSPDELRGGEQPAPTETPGAPPSITGSAADLPPQKTATPDRAGTGDAVGEDAPRSSAETLTLLSAERDFAAIVAAGLRTPRMVKKFTNLYRLYRAGFDRRLGALEVFLHDDVEDAPEYQVVLILLAASIAFPRSASTLLASLLTDASEDRLWTDYLRSPYAGTWTEDLTQFLLKVTPLDRHDHWTCQPFRRRALDVSRYSFTAGQEVFARFSRVP